MLKYCGQAGEMAQSDLTIALTFDVEANSWYYVEKTGEKYSGLTKAMPRVLDILFDRGVPATWFITHDREQRIDQEFPSLVEKMNENGEIGCHVHFLIGAGPSSRFEQSIVSQMELIENATLLLRARGFRVCSFRGGNNFFDENTLKVLEKLGYLIDSSVVPGYCSTLYPGFVVNHKRRLSSKPYFPSYFDHCVPGNSKILEIPIAICPYARFQSRFLSIFLGRPMSIFGRPDLKIRQIKVIMKDSLKMLRSLIPIVLTAHPYNFLSNPIERAQDLDSFIMNAKEELNARFVTLNEIGKKHSDTTYSFENQIPMLSITTSTFLHYVDRMPLLRKHARSNVRYTNL
jgi:peptidoglycan/xylan/chitin deacetylase (PgdA/CDA1 family)